MKKITAFIIIFAGLGIIYKLNFYDKNLQNKEKIIQKHKNSFLAQKDEAEKTLNKLNEKLKKYGATDEDQSQSEEGRKLYDMKLRLMRKLDHIEESLYRLFKGEIPEKSLTIFDRTAFEHEFVV